MLHVYGIIDGSEIRAAIPSGHHRFHVTAHPVGDLAAAVSAASQSDIAATMENIWCHDRVLDALMKRHAVLPMRFGTIANSDRLTADLERRRVTLCRALRRVSGKVEIAVRVFSKLPATIPETHSPCGGDDGRSSGTAYLRSRMAQRRRTAQLCERGRAAVASVLARLEALSADAVWDREGAPTLPVEASFLIAREAVPAFVDRAEALVSCDHDLSVSCTGPWAPYSFVTDVGMGP
ncbi:MAG: GvpL/GvpF family gas vesicle protein [Kiloniellales bacterium]|nr:GvpL/GvpF family gas vesicle protein [Kiloniellales bacterium]